jgi:alanyl-tRNA synthetase
MKTTEIRDRFLKFFERHGHTVVASSSLVPGNDPTLLFTNAGMVQFKDVFLGIEKRPYVRAVSSQRCVRAGGKHNDLENVGYTARHHTFFEMLGNFSFGDYFKRDAIRFAWEFLTRDLKLPAEKLWVTIYKDDDEAADIWLKEIKVEPGRFIRLGEKSNFWQMGDTGPCGPCSEIFYDHGPGVAGGPPGSPDEDGDRYIEIWNLVFMQYNRDADGKLHPLPKPSVDTGMGLERIAAVQQGVHSNYEIDLFRALIDAVAGILGVTDRTNKSLNVIADHIRSCAFLIVDGVLPSNEGRGYVLRRIIRRAARHGHLLGATQPFFFRLVAPLVKEMGAAYPELARAQTQVERALRQEEERFAETLSTGLRILEDDIAKLKGKKVIPGDTVFRLYDTYGFPADLTADIARERGLALDMDGFEREMDKQRNRARAASRFDAGYHKAVELDHSTEFSGYVKADDQGHVTELYAYGDDDMAVPVSELKTNELGILVLDRTPFYAESGGQVGDRGYIDSAKGRFAVQETVKHPSGAHLHRGRVESGVVRVGDTVQAHIDSEERQKTRLNHSATHLLHAALRQVLGKHVTQKGSLVHSEYLRFDFSHSEPLTKDQLQEIEELVNAQIRANDVVETRVMPIKEAMAAGAMALFGEKYGDEVRVVGMGEFSTELCGGTHVQRTGDIGLFKIVSEGGVASGVRRIEAVTGEGAFEATRETEQRLAAIAELVRGSRDEAPRKVEQLLSRIKGLEKEIETLRQKLASGQGGDLSTQAKDVKGAKVLAARVEGADAKTLRDTLDKLKDKLKNAAIVLAAVQDGKVTLVAGVTKDLMAKVPAGELVNQVAIKVGGKGGGRPDMAQAGGNDPSRLDAALADIPAWVESRL